jgi:hypothetical protein
MRIKRLRQLCSSFRSMPAIRSKSPETVDLSTSVIISQRVKTSAHADGLVLLAIDSGELFTCNRTGGRIWRDLADRRPPATIASDLTREYGLPAERVRTSVADFVGELLRAGLAMPDRRN